MYLDRFTSIADTFPRSLDARMSPKLKKKNLVDLYLIVDLLGSVQKKKKESFVRKKKKKKK